MSEKEHPPLQHVPVLLDATLALLDPQVGEAYLDLTAGYGGHASAFLARTHNYHDAVLVDRDAMTHPTLQRFVTQGATLLHSDFAAAATQLVAQGAQFDIVLVDLGISSPQLAVMERGFSFYSDSPLDMRMDTRQTVTAATVVNEFSERQLAQLIMTYGEEPRVVAARYAHALVTHRPFRSTKQLAEVIASAHRGSWQKIHPATRTFQAIRIKVNDELGQIETMLNLLPHLVRSGGRVGIISFHSLEDRLVKRYFAAEGSAGYEAQFRILTKKPRFGTEDVYNPRARSAKLRAAVKI